MSVGERTGVFESWADCSPLVTDYPGARHKSFWHREDAEAWYQEQMAGLAREAQDRREQAVAERERALARNAEQRRLTSAYIASKSAGEATQYFYSHQTQVQFDPRVRGAAPAPLPVAGNAGYFGGPASSITRGATRPPAMAVSGVAAVTRGNAQAEREREAEWDTYNTVFYGNPHGADGLARPPFHASSSPPPGRDQRAPRSACSS